MNKKKIDQLLKLQIFLSELFIEPSEQPEDTLSTWHEIEKIMQDKLNYRQKSILIMYYGLDGAKVKTLKEIGDNYFDLSGTTISRIRKQGIKKLRNHLIYNHFYKPRVYNHFYKPRIGHKTIQLRIPGFGLLMIYIKDGATIKEIEKEIQMAINRY